MTFAFLRVLEHPPPARWQRSRQRADGQKPRIFPVQGIFWVMLLLFLAGYAFLGFGIIRYRRPVLPFNPNISIGSAAFHLLHSNLHSRVEGGGACVRWEEDIDLLLIQTSATRFEDFVTYSRRIASPNDHDLVAVFVHDTILGQRWKELARGGFQKNGSQYLIPSNWLAKLFINQNDFGTSASLANLQTYAATAEQQIWWARTNYRYDSLAEKITLWGCPGCDTVTGRVSHVVKRRLTTADAAYNSLYRLKVRQWATATPEFLPPHTSRRSR